MLFGSLGWPRTLYVANLALSSQSPFLRLLTRTTGMHDHGQPTSEPSVSRKLSAVVHACNPSTWERLRQKCQFKVKLAK